MNMENFISGYPGSGSGIRSAFATVLGKPRAEFFFDSLLDYFFYEEDVAFLKECGSTAVRLPLNYRHFEMVQELARHVYEANPDSRTDLSSLDRSLVLCADPNR